MYRQIHLLAADNWHVSRYNVQSADIVQLANDRMSADYLQYRNIGRISELAEFLNLDMVCILMRFVALQLKLRCPAEVPE